MQSRQVSLSAFLLAILATSFLASCKKSTDVMPAITTTPQSSTVASGVVTDGEVNDWILANMSYYYLWNDKLPTAPNKTLTPDNFFLSLLYDRNNTANSDRDRFSWIQQSADQLKASLSGESKTTGMDYKLYYSDASRTNVVGSVIYVLPGTPAAQAGVKRGDLFTKVNGQILTGSNYSTLLNGTSDSYTFTFAKLVNGTLVEDAQAKTVSAIVFQEDPVLLDTTYTIGGKTIGYVVYNQFVPGPNGSSVASYDLKLDNIFGKFKQKGVNELVLDLRYNRGGYVSSSTNLASLIGKNIDASKSFYSQKWNATYSADADKKYGVGKWGSQNFVAKTQNIGASISQVYVLTTNSTASASELIINGLRPFMTVTTIGTTTVGKNVGSITISDPNGRIKWGMQPLTFKSANAIGFSDYPDGFVPAVEVKEPAYGLKALGDLSEPLLNEAVFQITGSRTARRAAPSPADFLPVAASSLDGKSGGGNMFIEQP